METKKKVWHEINTLYVYKFIVRTTYYTNHHKTLEQTDFKNFFQKNIYKSVTSP